MSLVIGGTLASVHIPEGSFVLCIMIWNIKKSNEKVDYGEICVVRSKIMFTRYSDCKFKGQLHFIAMTC